MRKATTAQPPTMNGYLRQWTQESENGAAAAKLVPSLLQSPLLLRRERRIPGTPVVLRIVQLFWGLFLGIIEVGESRRAGISACN